MSCKDTIAQQYLIESIIQVFPDEFHLAALEDLLATTSQLQAGVDNKAILVALMNRLAAFAKAEPASIPSDMDMLAIFQSHVSSLATGNLELSALLDLQVALVNFALGLAPDRLDFVDLTFASVAATLTASNTTYVQGKARDAMVSLLRTPMLSNGKPLEVLALANYAPLMAYLPLASRREVATLVARLTVSGAASISSAQEVDALLSFLQPLVKDVVEDGAGEEGEGGEDEDDFEAGQHLVASLIHRFHNPDTQLLYQMYLVARKHFGQGGPRRIKHTLVPLVFRAMMLARAINKAHAASGDQDPPLLPCKKVLGFVLETIKGLASSEACWALRLLLQGAQCANECNEDKIAYEFVSQVTKPAPHTCTRLPRAPHTLAPAHTCTPLPRPPRRSPLTRALAETQARIPLWCMCAGVAAVRRRHFRFQVADGSGAHVCSHHLPAPHSRPGRLRHPHHKLDQACRPPAQEARPVPCCILVLAAFLEPAC